MAGALLSALPAHYALADGVQITDRSLTLESSGDTGVSDIDSNGVPDGGNMPGATVKHLFKFTVNSGASIGSMVFQYCTTAAPVAAGVHCVAPTGMSVNGVTLTGATSGGSSDNTWTGMQKTTVDDASDTTINEVILEKTSAAPIATGTVLTFELSGVVNPTSAQTFFVRISTLDGTDGTGNIKDSGTVAAATSEQVNLSGTMPESLVFCAGSTIGLTNGVPDCTTAGTDTINFNSLFSPTATSFATSQMAASTNAGQGYAITVNGPTMTSGSNTINPINTGTSPNSDQSKFGNSQFGLNLKQNTGTEYTNAPNISANGTEPDSAEISPASGSGNYHGEAAPASGYDVAGYFRYNDGSVVADSGSGYTLNAPGGTDAQIYTVSYIVNVPGSQPAGSYTTTLTYICTPTF